MFLCCCSCCCGFDHFSRNDGRPALSARLKSLSSFMRRSRLVFLFVKDRRDKKESLQTCRRQLFILYEVSLRPLWKWISLFITRNSLQGRNMSAASVDRQTGPSSRITCVIHLAGITSDDATLPLVSLFYAKSRLLPNRYGSPAGTIIYSLHHHPRWSFARSVWIGARSRLCVYRRSSFWRSSFSPPPSSIH